MPVLIPMNMIRQMAPQLEAVVEPGQVTLTQLFSLWSNLAPDKWNQAYHQFILQLSPGLNEIIIHLASDNEEMQAITIDHPDFGSEWRQRDYNFVVSAELKALLKQTNTYLVTWRDIQKILNPQQKP